MRAADGGGTKGGVDSDRPGGAAKQKKRRGMPCNTLKMQEE